MTCKFLDGVKSAMEAHHRSLLKPKPAQKKPNSKPEKQVERACVEWMRIAGWSGQVYESKAKQVNGVWRSAGMKYGTADWQGNTDEGIAAYVEFKAAGKRSTFNRQNNYRQKKYILDKISANAFAVVVDNVCLLTATYKEWHKLRSMSLEAARAFLLSSLP